MNDILSKTQRLALKSQAHHLHPVVMIGQKGLSEAVIQETDTALRAHELIKVRVLGDDREERIAIAHELCHRTGAQLVQHIGKLLVLYRQKADEQE